MNNIEEIQQEIISEYGYYEDWMEKYELIIEAGKSLEKMEDTFKTDENMIRGCQSRVWLHSTYRDGRVFYEADSDAIITRGLIALLIRTYNSQSPQDIIETKPHFVEAIGLREHLSPTRSNGLLAMIKQIKLEALAYEAKHSNDDKEAD